MSKLKIDHGDWVVICDGTKAMVLANAGSGKTPNLRTTEVYTQSDPATHQQGTDAPGRAMNSVGNARSAVDQTDWHDQTEREFLRRLANRLDVAVAAGLTKSLIVVAPPRTLGVMRQAYSDHLRNAIRAELDKDFVTFPVREIENLLTSM